MKVIRWLILVVYEWWSLWLLKMSLYRSGMTYGRLISSMERMGHKAVISGKSRIYHTSPASRKIVITPMDDGIGYEIEFVKR